MSEQTTGEGPADSLANFTMNRQAEQIKCLELRVAELTKERDAKQDDLDVQFGQLQESRKQVAELTAKLAEKERERKQAVEIVASVCGGIDQSQLIGFQFSQAYKRLIAALAEARKDSERVDKLEWLTVNVRQPLVYGSRDLFWSSPDDNDGDETPSDIRKQIDALPPAPSTE